MKKNFDRASYYTSILINFLNNSPIVEEILFIRSLDLFLILLNLQHIGSMSFLFWYWRRFFRFSQLINRQAGILLSGDIRFSFKINLRDFTLITDGFQRLWKNHLFLIRWKLSKRELDFQMLLIVSWTCGTLQTGARRGFGLGISCTFIISNSNILFWRRINITDGDKLIIFAKTISWCCVSPENLNFWSKRVYVSLHVRSFVM